jgi:hypothetical protein
MRLLTLLISLALARPAHGQSVTIAGRILRGGPEGVPLRGQWAVLHRIAPSSAGALDSVRTDAAGRYVLRLPRVDSTAHYFVSTDYAGIGYFSGAVNVDHGPRVAVGALLVYDTTSAGPPIALRRRLVTVGLPGADGSREVLELLELLNVGTRTRVAPDSVHAVWTGALPGGAIQFRVGESDVSPDAVQRDDDRIAVFAPLPPGQLHQVTYQYYLPAMARRLAIPLDQPVTDFNLLLEDTAAVVTGPPLERAGIQGIEGRRFAGFRADALPGGAGSLVTVTFSAPPFRLDRLVPWIAGAVAVALVVGLWIALRKKPSADSRQSSVVSR